MAGLGAIVRRQTCRMRRVTGSSTGTAMTPDGSDSRPNRGTRATAFPCSTRPICEENSIAQ